MDLFPMLDELQAIARNGLQFAANPYDRDRYERILNLAIRTYGGLLDVPDDAVRSRFLAETGYITPKIGADAAVFNENGELLLMDRADGSGWCMPCGWVEPNEKPAETAVRETREETGLEVEIKQLVGVFTRKSGLQTGPHTMVAVVHLCSVVGGILRLSHEGLALRYWRIDDVEHWHGMHERYARASYAFWKSNRLLPAVSD